MSKLAEIYPSLTNHALSPPRDDWRVLILPYGIWVTNLTTNDGYRLAHRVARAYAARVEGEATVEQADAGSEPVGLIDCFIGSCVLLGGGSVSCPDSA